MEIQSQGINWWIVLLAMGMFVLLFGYVAYNIETVKHQPCSVCAKSIGEDIKCYYGFGNQINFNENGSIDNLIVKNFGRMDQQEIDDLNFNDMKGGIENK